jgi:hypothetical protein
VNGGGEGAEGERRCLPRGGSPPAGEARAIGDGGVCPQPRTGPSGGWGRAIGGATNAGEGTRAANGSLGVGIPLPLYPSGAAGPPRFACGGAAQTGVTRKWEWAPFALPPCARKGERERGGERTRGRHANQGRV